MLVLVAWLPYYVNYTGTKHSVTLSYSGSLFKIVSFSEAYLNPNVNSN